MNRELAVLAAHASERARKDTDLAARPLWAQIAAEVTTYLTHDTETTTPGQDHPALFDATPAT